MALKAASLRNMKPGRHPDGRYGLYFNVKPTGARSWLQRLVIDGERRTAGLGPYPVVSLAEARDAAFENVRMRQRGINPFSNRNRPRAVPTFAEAADSYIAIQRVTWKKGSRNEANWRSSLAHAKAIAGERVDSIMTDDVAGIVTALLTAGKGPTAKAVRQRIRLIFDWCIAQGHRTDNPANGSIDAILPKSNHRTEHRKSVPHVEVPSVLRSIRSIDKPTWRGMIAATEFAILTGMRSGEVTGATWSEIDMDAAVWTVGPERMKMSREHRVPLSQAALSILRAMRDRHGATGLVFRSPRGKEIERLIPVLREVGCDADIHGFRSSLRDWCAENGVDHAVGELCIAHYPSDSTVKAYLRTDRLSDRAPVMERWAEYLTT